MANYPLPRRRSNCVKMRHGTMVTMVTMVNNSQKYMWTEVLGHSLVRSSVRSHRSLVRSLTHFAHSLARGKVNY